MHRPTLIALLIGTVALCALAKEPRAAAPAAGVSEQGVTVYFSPKGGCEAAVVEQITDARKTLDIQAYSFTNTTIAAAVSAAHDRGVKVRVILDEKTNVTGQYSIAKYLTDHQIPTWTDGAHPIAHAKIMVIDGSTIITGSFNFTKQAESNSENLLVIEGHTVIAKAYIENFEKHLKHSVRYMGTK